MNKYYDFTKKQLRKRAFRSLKKLVLHKNSIINSKLSYYPEEEHKSNLSVFCDQLRHIFKYGAINDNYYHYGLDVKGADCNQFIYERWHLDNARRANRKFCGLKHGHDYIVLLADKYLFAELMNSNGFPIPKSYGFIKNGEFYAAGNIKDPVDLLTICKLTNHFLCKPITGSSGRGILNMKVQDGELVYKNNMISLDEFKELVSMDKFLVQGFIENQHPAMSALFPKSINTLRVTMVRTEKGIEVLGCMCLMGASNAEFSNWHYGGICVNVDKEGRLGKYGFSFSEKRIIKHPDTGVVFEGYQIPYFEETVEWCKKAMNLFYGMKTIGWDMAFTEDGPIFIEGNNGWGIAAHQMVEHQGWAERYFKAFK